MNGIVSQTLEKMSLSDSETKGKQGIHLENTKRGEVVIEMRGITKYFPGVIANDHIDFDLKAGEVHSLLGENGAGKTTLMNILYGLYQPDEGEIRIRGKRVVLKSPSDAIEMGIGMVHQLFMLLPSFTVAENVILGLKGFMLNLDQVEKEIAELSEEYCLRVDPKAIVWQLSVGERQRVEVIKALYRGAQLLILDEPTSMLTPPETKELMKIIRRMVDEGLTVIPFVTHKLPEVIAVSDRVTVLRRGKVVATIATGQTNERNLAEEMVGRKVVFAIKRQAIEKNEVVLEVTNLEALDDRGLSVLKKISFSIYAGEVLGVAGVSGNGQHELAEVLTGLRKATTGKINLQGEDVTNKSPSELIAKRVGYIPEERIGKALVSGLSVAENLILGAQSEKLFTHGLFLNQQAINEHADKLISEYNIATPDRNTKVRNLSGGNLQRLILARELSRKPKLLVANQLTSGLDVGATEFIHNKLIEQKMAGTAILLISEDLDEIMSMSDRIAVMYRGEIVGIIPAANARIEEVGLMMAGAKRLVLKEDSI